MMNNEISPVVKNFIIAFWDGQPLPVSEALAKDLQSRRPDTFTIGTTLYNFKSVKFIGTAEKFKEQFPGDQKTSNYNPINRPLQSFEDIAEEFKWTGYPNMLQLITLTHRRLREWKGDFKNFCLKHNAITADGKITTMRITVKSGRVEHVPFAYPFFCAVAKLIESRDKKREYAEEKSWEQLGII